MLRKIADYISASFNGEDILLHGTLVPLTILMLRAVFSDLRNEIHIIDILLLTAAVSCAVLNIVLFGKPYREIKYRSIREIPKWQLPFLIFYAVSAAVPAGVIIVGAFRTLAW